MAAFTSRRTLPANYAERDLPYFEHERTRQIAPTVLFRLSEALVSNEGVVLNRLGVFEPSLLDRGLWRRWDLRYSLATRIKRRRIRLSAQDPHLLAFNFAYPGYYHWITETLPRLFILRDHAPQLTALVPRALPPVQMDSLQPFGLSRLQFIESDTYVQVPQLWMPSHTAPTGNYNDLLVRGLASWYWDCYRPAATLDLGPRLYVSRSRARFRRVSNEDAAVEVLARRGFRVVHFEDHSFAEQVSLTRNATHLVSLHGAGLTNILFLPPSGRVLELRKTGDYHSNCYFALASALGLPYYYLLCDGLAEEDAHTADVFVPLPRLEQTLDAFLA